MARFLPDAWWAIPPGRRHRIAGAVAVTLLAVPLLVAARAGGRSEPATAAGSDTEAVAFLADLPPQRVASWDELAQCESSGDWAIDTGNTFYGGLQFTLDSWKTVGGEGSPADASRAEQIMRAEQLQDLQGWKAWPVCSEEIGLR